MDQQENKLWHKRGKAKYITDYGLKEIHSYYTQKYGAMPVTKEQYKDILKEFHEHVIDNVLLSGHIYNMPGNMGILTLTYRYPTTIIDEKYNIVKTDMPIDYKRTLELWARDPEAKRRKKKLYIINEETDGKIFKFKYKPLGKIAQTYNAAYDLQIVRRLKRENLLEAIKSGRLR